MSEHFYIYFNYHSAKPTNAESVTGHTNVSFVAGGLNIGESPIDRPTFGGNQRGDDIGLIFGGLGSQSDGLILNETGVHNREDVISVGVKVSPSVYHSLKSQVEGLAKNETPINYSVFGSGFHCADFAQSVYSAIGGTDGFGKLFSPAQAYDMTSLVRLVIPDLPEMDPFDEANQEPSEEVGFVFVPSSLVEFSKDATSDWKRVQDARVMAYDRLHPTGAGEGDPRGENNPNNWNKPVPQSGMGHDDDKTPAERMADLRARLAKEKEEARQKALDDIQQQKDLISSGYKRPPTKYDPNLSEAAAATGGQGDQGKGSGWGGMPILLDLDGNGIEITELSNSTIFTDAGGNGLKHKTAWAGAGDGVFDAKRGRAGPVSIRFRQRQPSSIGRARNLGSPSRRTSSRSDLRPASRAAST